ncbi:transglutaminase-like domain-containing protein [Flavobacterium adhaerens]|uniref:transglutaminase-like domain-containing protein n=1 Tax=Flavobacterium adhaerens TaxID=3149043 RepID=UPI0032B3EB94
MIKFILNLLIFLLFTLHSFAQKSIDPTPEDITKAKSLRETYNKDDVAILESTEKIAFDLNKDQSKVMVKHNVNELLMNINHRADIQKYEFYDSESKIDVFNLNFRNDKKTNFYVKDEFYKDKDLFYNDARVKYMNIDFPFQGYTYKYEIEKRYEDVKYFRALYFNDEFPVLKKQITITIPSWLTVELKEFNFKGNNITKEQAKDSKNNTVYTYTLNNIPGIYKEENSPGRSYLYPHILVIAKSFKAKDKEVTLFNSTADLYKWYKSLVDSMKDDPTVLKEKVKELTANAKTDEEKIKNIYYWVQDNIRYIAFEDGIAGFKPDECNNVFSNRYGDCKGMANLIKQMLKLAGFDARLTWIGTKHIAYDYTTPSLAVDNHMICTLFYKGKKYYLDGTENYAPLGENAERIQNKEIMIENGNDFIIEKVPLMTDANNKETFKSKLHIENNQLKGTCSRSYIGESRTQFLKIYNSFKTNKKSENLESYLSSNDKNIQIDAVKTSDLNNRDIKLTLDYEITIANKVSSFDNEMYIDIEYNNEFKNMNLKDRKTDYQFDYKENYESITEFTIPNGYKVTKLPTNFVVTENDYTVSLTFEKTPKAILYKKQFIFKNAEIKTTEIAKWQTLNKNLNENYNQQITLTKI